MGEIMLRILFAALTAVVASAVAIPPATRRVRLRPTPRRVHLRPTPRQALPPRRLRRLRAARLLNSAGETLPPVVVQQEEPAKPPKPPAKPKKVASPRKPSAPREVVTAEEVPAPSPLDAFPQDANPLVNPGTPSAGVAPILGGASSPGAQTATAVDVSRLEDEPLFTVGDILRQSPGVSVKQGNGPRDLGISIRGSNARNGFGIRNIVIYDDGFPVTQPDGLSRSDLIDPHAYIGVDVWRGPSSALFGNYATGGALNFRTWPGGKIDGISYGLDGGSFNYWNNYLQAGTKTQRFEGGLFLSDVRGDGYYGYSAFDTQTANLLVSYKLTPRDTITLKGINNELYTELPVPHVARPMEGESLPEGLRDGGECRAGLRDATISRRPTPLRSCRRPRKRTAPTGMTGAPSAAFAGSMNSMPNTTGRIQYVIDDRNINQPTGTTSAIGDFLSSNVIADMTHATTLAGLPAKYLVGSYWNTLPVDSQTYYVAPGGNARLGKLQSTTEGSTTNLGARARQELALPRNVIMTAGVDVEKSWIEGLQHSFTYDSAGMMLTDTPVSAERSISNVAPEIGLLWRPSTEWQYRARVGTGFGIPQFGNLFVTPEGVPGNNTELKTQKNIGYDLGVDWTPLPKVMLSLTGFYEFFRGRVRVAICRARPHELHLQRAALGASRDRGCR